MVEILALVVEDEPLLRGLAVEAIADTGIACLEAGSADEAVILFAEHPEIGLLFTDVNMPGTMDGVSLAWFVRQMRPDIFVVITSGRGTVPAARLPENSLFLPTPYRAAELIALVSEKLLPSRKRRESGSSNHAFA